MVALALLVAPARPAHAHALLVNSSPGSNAVLPDPPAEVVLTFSESVREVPDKVRVIGPDGKRVDRGRPKFDGAVVTIPVDSGPRGTYLVSYRVVSADSHPVSGGYTYSVGETSEPPADTGGETAGDPVVTTAVKVAKYVGYIGLILLVGPLLTLSLFWPRRLSRRGPARLVWTGVGLVTAATLADLWLQVPYTSGGKLFEVTGGDLADVLVSGYGVAHLVRLGALVAAVIVIPPLLAGRATRSDQVVLAGAGVAAVATWPLAGHPAASPVPAVSVVVDAVHLSGVAVWLGGLVMLGAFLLRQASSRELAVILPVWSRWAAVAVGALLLTGAGQAVIEVGALDALTDTTYGRLILAKVVLLVLVLAVAGYSHRLVERYAGDVSSRRLRWAVLAELTVTAVILAVSANLVQTIPARTAAATAAADAFFSTTLTSPLYKLQVEVEPARVGGNAIHLYSLTADNKALPVVEWKATIALPEKGIEPIEIPLITFTDYHVLGEIRLPTAGDWQLRVTARTSDIDQATVTATVPIR
ncbi:MAG TPA: copper resistance protein CopC [Micromonosporaceae bacterium]|nr:copper resistance protein CopC [Micromonosporaceae bacterium]